MSPQLELLKNAIASAQQGNSAAVVLLRMICKECVEMAPEQELISIADFLAHMGLELEKVQIRRN